MIDKTGEDFQVVTFSSSKDDIVNVDDLDKEYQNLIIFRGVRVITFQIDFLSKLS